MNSLRRNKARTIAKKMNAIASGGESFNHGSAKDGAVYNGDNVCCFGESFMRNHENLKKSKAPCRIMFYRDSLWNDYPEEIFNVLRDGFLGGKATVFVRMLRVTLIIDLLRMLEINLVTGLHRSIAWIDTEGTCFFPQLFVGGLCGACDASTSLREEDASREDVDPGNEAESDAICTVAAAEASRPAGLFQPTTVPTAKMFLKLKEDEKAYGIIKNAFTKGLRKFASETTVTAVYRCPSGGVRFQAFKKVAELTKAARGHADVTYAWHGTSKKEIGNIVLHGFGSSNLSSGPNTFGIGVNLSPANDSYSSASLAELDDGGEQHVMLCRVVMGNMEEIQLGSDQSHPSCEEYDNGVDDVMKPRKYIVWSTNIYTDILPEYVLSFKFSPRLQELRNTIIRQTPVTTTNHEQRRPSPFTYKLSGGGSMSFPKLLSAIERFLPPSKRRELQLLYGAYKSGKISKDILIRKMRAITGDQLLIAVIKTFKFQKQV